MQWNELIESLCGERPPLLVTTATTGVNDSDTLIAAFSIDPASRQTNLVMRRLGDELLAPAAQYHGIDGADVRFFGVDDDMAVKRLGEMVAEHTLFSYNPEFQQRFIGKLWDGPVTVHDMPTIMQAADMRLPLPEGLGLGMLDAWAERTAGGVLTFRAACRKYRLAPRELLLPLQSSCWQLYDLWEQLSEIPAVR